MTDHSSFMQRCITLALHGRGTTSPNPMVGAVLVHEERIIGEGYHDVFGGAHAEVNCINSVVPNDVGLISQSTLYVSLEPCSHYGKTPPCADLVIKNKIPCVVIGCRDSYEKVNGSGIEKLNAAGIKTITGVLEKECRALNRNFFTFHEKGRPYIILKWAQSGDGFIAGENGKRVKISNQYTDSSVHKWRAEEDAILVGTNTVITDNPSLNVRQRPGKDPVRLVIDANLTIDSSAKIFNGAVSTIIFNRIKNETRENICWYKVSEGENIIEGILHCCKERNLQSVIVEGGAKTIQAFYDVGLWDEARMIINTDMNIHTGITAPILKNEIVVSDEKIVSDSITLFKHAENEFL